MKMMEAQPMPSGKKQFELVKLTGSTKGNKTSVVITSSGQYKGKPQQRTVDLYIHGIAPNKGLMINGHLRDTYRHTADGILIDGIVWKNNKVKVELK